MTPVPANDRMRHLLECGFKPEQARKVAEAVRLRSISESHHKISALRALGFADPVKIITSNPTILNLATDTIRSKLADLRALGFENPIKMIASNPAILSLAIEHIRAKLLGLTELGFTEPVKMITRMPTILGYGIDNIRTKLAGLAALGFNDPLKMAATSPAILGLGMDNIRGKLADLRLIGFLDPVKMVTGFPSILGYASTRILRCGRIVMALDDASPGMFVMLISKRSTIIDAVAATQPQSWSEVDALIKMNNEGSNGAPSRPDTRDRATRRRS